jgi:hypothetical protein
MSLGTAAKALSVWAAILVMAFANGILREAVLIPSLGRTLGLVLSGLLLSCLILLTAYVSLPWLGIRGSGELIAVGLAWLALTLVFEFSFGLSRGRPLSEILEAYTFKDGNIWPVVLLITALSPWLAGTFRAWLGRR